MGEGSFPSPLVSQFYHRLGGCVNETDRVIHCGTYLPDRRVGRCGVWPGPADLQIIVSAPGRGCPGSKPPMPGPKSGRQEARIPV